MFVRLSDKKLEFKSLRRCLSAGEPLNPEVIDLWRERSGLEISEGYGQTETVILCGSFINVPIKPGSMGVSAPGINLQVINEKAEICAHNEEGDLAVEVDRQHLNGLFLEYKDDKKRTESVFKKDIWYLTGDRAYRDADGYFWFVGRSDDVILSSGYRIGPFEVESALFEHKAVLESAVVSSSDPVRGEVVKAFVVLQKGYELSGQLILELQDYARRTTAPYKYPRKLEFVEGLPKTVSGKIKRGDLKAQEWRTPLS
jgi:acyl-coenzyme A synthetase/AMP-(fatty) acid ligase